MTPVAAATVPAAGAPSQAFKRRLAAVLLIALLTRVAVLLYAEWRPARFDFPDSQRYVAVARNIAAGRGPIDCEQVRAGTDPVFPYLLSVAIRLGATGTDAILRFGRLTNSVIGLASVVVLAAVARRRFGESVAIVAALILAVDPILLFFNALVLTESLYILLLLLACLAIVHAASAPPVRAGLSSARTTPTSADGSLNIAESATQSRRIACSLCAGALLGIGAATRSTGLFMPLFLLPAVWLMTQARGTATRVRIATCMALLIGALAALSPTLVRNYRLFGQFVPVRTGGGASLLEALGPWADGSPGMDRIEYPPVSPGADEVARDADYRDAALEWAARHPARSLQLAGRKLIRTWAPVINAADFRSPWIAAVSLASVVPVYMFALAGIWLIRRRPADLLLLIAPAAYFTLIHMVFVGSVRYRVPAMPLIFILAAIGIHAAWIALRRSPAGDRAATDPFRR